MAQTLWQTAIANAAFAAALCLVLLPLARLIGRPALTHAVCLIVLLKFLTPPLWTFTLSGSWGSVDTPRSLPGAALTPPGKAAAYSPGQPVFSRGLTFPLADRSLPQASAGVSTQTVAPVLSPQAAPRVVPDRRPTRRAVNVSWATILATIWAAGTAACVGVMVRRVVAARRLLKFVDPAPDSLQRRTRSLAKLIGLESAPPVEFIPGRSCPMLLAFFGTPRLLVPVNLWKRLTPGQQDTLLLHELAHFRRRDHWVRYIELAATALYWWHPMLWWCRRELREAEEQCCDAWVVWAEPAGARTYAMTLLDTADWVMDYSKSIPAPAALPMLASGMSLVRHLERRIVMIKQASAPRALGWQGLALVAGLAAATLCVSPGFAQQTPEAPAEAPPAPTAPATENAPAADDQHNALADALVMLDSTGSANQASELARAQAEISRLDSQLRQAQQRLAELYRKSGKEVAGISFEPSLAPSALDGRLTEARVNSTPPVAEPTRAPISTPAPVAIVVPGSPMRPGAATPPPVAIVVAGSAMRPGAPTPPPVAMIGGGAMLTAPAAPPAPGSDGSSREDRLDRLEIQLQAMLEEVRSLRSEHAAPADPARAN